SGWAIDPTNPSANATVEVWVQGQVPPAHHYQTLQTSLPRPDVNQALGVTGNHGFSVPMPDQYKDGQLHYVRVYVRTATGLKEISLGGSMGFRCSTPVNVWLTTSFPLQPFTSGLDQATKDRIRTNALQRIANEPNRCDAVEAYIWSEVNILAGNGPIFNEANLSNLPKLQRYAEAAGLEIVPLSQRTRFCKGSSLPEAATAVNYWIHLGAPP